MTTTSQNDGGEIATPRTKLKLIELYNKYLRLYQIDDMPRSKADELQYEELGVYTAQLETELHQANLQIAMDTIRLREITELGIKRDIELEQANISAATWENQARYLVKDQSVKFDKIESLKQEVIEWRDDRQKVNADLSEELAKAKEQSANKSEVVAELVNALSGLRDLACKLVKEPFNVDINCVRAMDIQVEKSLSRAAKL